MQKVELSTFQSGAVIELFNEEMDKVLSNIADENTAANVERSITVKISIKPDKTRRTAQVKTQVSSTLAKMNPAESLLWFDKDDKGKLSAFEDDPAPSLFDGDEKIKPFPAANER